MKLISTRHDQRGSELKEGLVGRISAESERLRMEGLVRRISAESERLRMTRD